jgi:two-component system cell cycle response regulator
LDLSLPDAEGLNTVEKIHAGAPGVPIVVLTGVDEEALGLEAIRIGAQDYMLKTEINPRLLRRAIRYAIERQRIDELRSLALCDELTGLLNARGFALLAEQQLRLAQRARMGLLLGFLDLDGLKRINDTYGHLEGNRALGQAATILRECLRNSDIIGRLGGDEFAVLAVEASSEGRGALISRLERALEAHNACRQHSYRLWFSIGLAAYDPFNPCSLEELVAQADQQMYAVKKQEANLSGKPNPAG